MANNEWEPPSLDSELLKKCNIKIPDNYEVVCDLKKLGYERIKLIKQHSLLFGKKDNRRMPTLNEFEILLNEISFQLCLRDPILLLNRQNLVKLSRDILRDSNFTSFTESPPNLAFIKENLLNENNIIIEENKESNIEVKEDSLKPNEKLENAFDKIHKEIPKNIEKHDDLQFSSDSGINNNLNFSENPDRCNNVHMNEVPYTVPITDLNTLGNSISTYTLPYNYIESYNPLPVSNYFNALYSSEYYRYFQNNIGYYQQNPIVYYPKITPNQPVVEDNNDNTDAFFNQALSKIFYYNESNMLLPIGIDENHDYFIIYYYKNHSQWPPTTIKTRRPYLRRKSKRFILKNNMLYCMRGTNEGKLWLPSSESVRIVISFYHIKNYKHLSLDETFSVIERNFYSPKMKLEIQGYLKECNCSSASFIFKPFIEYKHNEIIENKSESEKEYIKEDINYAQKYTMVDLSEMNVNINEKLFLSPLNSEEMDKSIQ